MQQLNLAEPPKFFIDLAKSYRDFLDHRAPPFVILICDPTEEEWSLLKIVGPSLRGPARWITTCKRGGWDDVDIAHVVRASYELYKDERLNIGDNPHKGYVGGKFIGANETGEDYGNFDKWLWAADYE